MDPRHERQTRQIRRVPHHDSPAEGRSRKILHLLQHAEGMLLRNSFVDRRTNTEEIHQSSGADRPGRTYFDCIKTLYLRERHVKSKTCRWERLTPRTVRDCIPTSRLAQYSNYEYDEARELSYSPMVIRFERLYETFEREEVGEPWMLEEIDDLFIGFLSYNYFLDDCPGEIGNCNENHENLPCDKDFCEMSYESPFLEAYNFEEMALKLRIVSQNLKKIWDTKYFPYYGWHPVTKAKNLTLFKSPACQMFSSLNEEMDSDWLKSIPETDGPLSQIKALTQSFKEQNTWIFKKQNSARSWLDPNQDPVDLSTHRRLYSAVLQGSAQNQLVTDRNRIASLQFPSPKKRDSTSKIEIATDTSTEPNSSSSTNYKSSSLAYTTTGIISVEQSVQMNRRMVDANANSLSYQCGYSYYTSKTNVQTTTSTSTPIASVFATPTSYNNYQYFPQSNNFFNPRVYSNNFIPNTSVLNFRQTNYFPLMLQNATAPYAHQSSFFNYQRGTFQNYGRTVMFPQRPQVVVPSSNWFLQQPVKIGQPAVNLLAPRPPIHAPGYQYRASSSVKPRITKPTPSSTNTSQAATKDDMVNQDLENIVAKTVSAVLDDPDPYVPVTGTPSDELELQALEQYSPSNDNVFQELERQAAEQYNETSENWRSPPKCDDDIGDLSFGGSLLDVKLVRFRCLEIVPSLECSGTFKTEVPILLLGYDRS